MTVKKPPDSDNSELSEVANDWLRQFLKHIELHLVDTGGHLSSESRPHDYHLAVLQAVKLTLLDSGMTAQEFRDLLDVVARQDEQRTAIKETDAMGYPVGYFTTTEGSFAGESLESPPDLPPDQRETW